MPSLRVLLFAALLHAAHGFSAAVPAVRLAHGRAVSVRPCVHGCALRAFNPLFPELEEPEDRPSPLEELVAKYGRVSARAGSLACAVSLLTGRSIMCKHAAVQSPFFVVVREHILFPCASFCTQAARTDARAGSRTVLCVRLSLCCSDASHCWAEQWY